MALSIKDETTDRLVRRYAKLKGVSFTRAIGIAVGDALEREAPVAEESDFMTRLRMIQALVAASPIDHRTDDEIIGYDEYGLPT